MSFHERNGDHRSKRREFDEFVKAGVDLLTVQRAEAFHAETLAAEAAHDGAVDDRAAQLATADMVALQVEPLLRQIADKSAGKAISRAGGIEDGFEQIARHHEKRIVAEQHGAVLA